MTPQGKLDTEALRRAHEDHDWELLTSLYTDGAESITVDKNNPPSSPRVQRGREEIGTFWKEVMGRDKTDGVRNLLEGPDKVSFQVDCLYPDGTRVLASHTLELEDGQIAREWLVQAWDG
jgi:SnoaL-like domain